MPASKGFCSVFIEMAQNKLHGKEMRDSLQKSLMEFYRERSHLIDSTDLDALALRTADRHYQAVACF